MTILKISETLLKILFLSKMPALILEDDVWVPYREFNDKEIEEGRCAKEDIDLLEELLGEKRIEKIPIWCRLVSTID